MNVLPSYVKGNLQDFPDLSIVVQIVVVVVIADWVPESENVEIKFSSPLKDASFLETKCIFMTALKWFSLLELINARFTCEAISAAEIVTQHETVFIIF